MNPIKIISSLTRLITLSLSLVLLLIVLLAAGYETESVGEPGNPLPSEKVAQASSFADHPGFKLFSEWGCKTCHAIDRIVIGPALGGVTERREREWIYLFVKNSSKLIESGDPTAVALFKEYKQYKMQSHEISNEEIDAILSYIEAAVQ